LLGGQSAETGVAHEQQGGQACGGFAAHQLRILTPYRRKNSPILSKLLRLRPPKRLREAFLQKHEGLGHFACKHC
jgi:hypothetical protein